MTDAPLPCPFCGHSIPRPHMASKGAWIVRCFICDCEGPVSDSEAGAVAAWNRRGPPDAATITRQAEDARAMHLASVTTLTGLIEALAPLVRLDPEGEVGEWAEKIRRRVEEIGNPAPVVLTEAEMEARWRAWLQRKNRLDRIAALRTPQGRDAHDEEERAAAIAMHEAVIAELEQFALTGVR